MKPLLGICLLIALAIVPPLAAGDGPPGVTLGTDDGLVYYQGETILFSGTNTAGDTTYLFVTAPGLPAGGVSPVNLSLPAETGNSSTFLVVPVSDDSSYAAVWDPAMAAPGGAAAGSYTVHASAAPASFSDLSGIPFASVTIFLVGGPSAVPLPTTPVTVTIPPTQEPFPIPTASGPSGTPVTIPPTQNPQTLPTVPTPSDPLITVPPTQTPIPLPTSPPPSEPQVPIPPTQEPFPVPTASDPLITVPPTQTPIPLPTPPVPVPLPSAPSVPGPIWPLPIIPADFESWSGWLVDQLVNFLIP